MGVDGEEEISCTVGSNGYSDSGREGGGVKKVKEESMSTKLSRLRTRAAQLFDRECSEDLDDCPVLASM